MLLSFWFGCFLPYSCYWDTFLLYLTCEFLLRLLNFSKFFVSVETIVWIWSILLLMWCITFNDLSVLNHPCTQEICRPISSWFLLIGGFEFSLLVFCWHCLHLCSSELWLIMFFFLVLSLSAFSVSITWPQVSLFSFVEKFEMDWYSFLFQGLVEFTSKAILSWTRVFVFSEDFDYWFILLTSNWFVQTFFSPWFGFIGCILLGICLFLYLSKILAYNFS